VVRYFHSFSRFSVSDDYLGSSQAFPQSLERSLDEVVLRPEALYTGDNLRVMAIAMGDDPGGGTRGAVIGSHGRFWAAAASFDVVLDKRPLLGSEVKSH